VASIFVLGALFGALVGYLGRGDGRPSKSTTVDVTLNQVTIPATDPIPAAEPIPSVP
jgi:hypothetical protein